MRNITLAFGLLLSVSNLFGRDSICANANGAWISSIWIDCVSSGTVSYPNSTSSNVTITDKSIFVPTSSNIGVGSVNIVASGSASTGLNIYWGATLNITGDLTITTSGTNTTVTINVDGTLNISGNIVIVKNGTNNTVTYGGSGIINIAGTPHTINGGGTLPVQLIDFTANPTAENVHLKWSTASELNFDYFTIEKSTDGENFHEVARVVGHGTSSLAHDYSFIDEKPVVGKSYYRLMETDFDKSVTHLKTIRVDFNGTRALALYPNPAANGGEVTMQLNFVPSQEVAVSIVDLRGITLNEFVVNKQSLTVPLQVASGTYLVVMRSTDFKSVSRLVVK